MLPTIHQEIIKGLMQDRSQAMKQIFELYYEPLCRYALRYTTSTTVAEEIASDVMFKIWQNRHSGYRAETFREYFSCNAQHCTQLPETTTEPAKTVRQLGRADPQRVNWGNTIGHVDRRRNTIETDQFDEYVA